MEEVSTLFPALVSSSANNNNVIIVGSSMAHHEEAEAAAGMRHHHHVQRSAMIVNPPSDNNNNTQQQHQNNHHHQEARQDTMGPQQTRSTLYQLRDSTGVEAALEQMSILDQWLDMHVEEETRKQTALRIANKYHGTTIILMTLERWKNYSKEFSGIAMHCLVNLSFLVPTTIPLIANAGKHLILSTSQLYAEDYAVTSNAIGLLHNCAEYQMKSKNDHDYATSEQVSSEDCLDLVMRTMKKWPTSSYHQERGCLYFYEMSKMPETRRLLLHQKGICSLLVQTLEAHRAASNGENQRVYQAAQLALFVYVSTPPSV